MVFIDFIIKLNCQAVQNSLMVIVIIFSSFRICLKISCKFLFHKKFLKYSSVVCGTFTFDYPRFLLL